MTWRLFTICFIWFTFLSFWVTGIFIFKPYKTKKRHKRWYLFLATIVFVTTTVEYLLAKHLTKKLNFIFPFDYLSDILGVVLILAGLLLAIWARITLGRFWSGSVAFIEGQPIVKDGPYSIVRHPIYTGVIMMLWGCLLLEPFGFVLLIAVFGTILLAYKARLEEGLLERHLGDKYSNYKKEVECSFIPG